MKRYETESVRSPMQEHVHGEWVLYEDALAAIEAARQEEREACALAIEQLGSDAWDEPAANAYYAAADLIRARGAK